MSQAATLATLSHKLFRNLEHPRLDRLMSIARTYNATSNCRQRGWSSWRGSMGGEIWKEMEVIGRQIEKEWRLLTGRVLIKEQQEEAWKVSRAKAEEGKAINF